MSFQSSDYKCEKCKHIDEFTKASHLDSFPERLVCSECGAESCRVWGVSAFDMCIGKCGNTKDGWKGGAFNHTSVLGKYQGTRIK